MTLNIGYNDEELSKISSWNDGYVQHMESYHHYEDALSQFIIKKQGCVTPKRKPYRAVDFTDSTLFTGLSWKTASQENKSSCVDSKICPESPEKNRSPVCSQVDFQI